MDDNKDKVLVACIIYDDNKHCFDHFWKSVQSQDFKNTDTIFVDCSANTDCNNALNKTGAKVIKGDRKSNKVESLVAARKIIKEFFKVNNYTHLLFVEHDILIPKQAISRMLFHKKDLITGVALTNMNFGDKYEIAPTLYDFAEEGSVRIMELREIIDDRLIEIFGASFSCTLISKTVLNKIDFRFFEKSMSGDDVAFFADARDAGFDVFADTSIKCNRLVKQKGDKMNDLFSFDAYPKIRSPRVLVGCVTYDKDEVYITGMLESIRSQDYRNYDIIFADTSDSEEFNAKLKGTGAIVVKGTPNLDHSIKKITDGREIIRQYAIDKGYDYLWFVDTDVIQPSTALSKMLADRKDIVLGLYLSPRNFNGVSKVLPVLQDFSNSEGYCRPMGLQEVLDNKLIEVSCGGFGCTLVTREVLSDVKLRYYEKSMAGEDTAFSVDAREKGFRTFADTSVRCAHLVFPPGDPRNRKFLFESYEKGTSYDIKVDNIAKD